MVRLLGIEQDKGSLAEIVEQQRGEHQGEPGKPDGKTPEMPHVGVKGLPAGHHQEDGPEDNETAPAVVDEEIDAMGRVDGGEDLRRTDNRS